MIRVPTSQSLVLPSRACWTWKFKPGDESLEVMLFEESRLPWKDIAFFASRHNPELWCATSPTAASDFNSARPAVNRHLQK